MTKSRALIQGYGSVRRLSVAEKQAIPVLAAGSTAVFLTRLYDWIVADALVSPKDPMEYWAIYGFISQFQRVSLRP